MKKQKFYYSFAVTCNGNVKTYSMESTNFSGAFRQLFKYYKSFNTVKFLGKSVLLSEAIMLESDVKIEQPKTN